MGCLENEWVGLEIRRYLVPWGFDSPPGTILTPLNQSLAGASSPHGMRGPWAKLLHCAQFLPLLFGFAAVLCAFFPVLLGFPILVSESHHSCPSGSRLRSARRHSARAPATGEKMKTPRYLPSLAITSYNLSLDMVTVLLKFVCV